MNRIRQQVIAFAIGFSVGIAALVSFGAAQAHPKGEAAADVTVDSEGTVHLRSLAVPFSTFASSRAKVKFLEFVKIFNTRASSSQSVAEQRRLEREEFQPVVERAKALYPVSIVPTAVAGVPADIITPKDGVAPANKNRVLINLHGGAFMTGAGIFGPLESIPVASLAKIKVITLDYRQGPEHKFPAASEDVTAVYKELLKTYKPQNIGIYGCSAGGVLTAEATAWIAKEKLPMPGAIGIFCGSAAGWDGGDSGAVSTPLCGIKPTAAYSEPPHASVGNVAYFSEADFSDPMVEPIHSPALLAKFPPTLIVTSTRDDAMSPAVYTHTQLVKLGVDAELHVWEGMMHGFFTYEPDLPETKEVWNVVTKFFDRHLGRG